MLVGIIYGPSSITCQIPTGTLKNWISCICSPSQISCSQKCCNYHCIYHKYDECILCQFGSLVIHKLALNKWSTNVKSFIWLNDLPLCTGLPVRSPAVGDGETHKIRGRSRDWISRGAAEAGRYTSHAGIQCHVFAVGNGNMGVNYVHYYCIIV